MACKTEFGLGYHVADYNQLQVPEVKQLELQSKQLTSSDPMKDAGQYPGGWLTRAGQAWHPWPHHYFIEMHNTSAPPGWEVIAEMSPALQDGAVRLGAAYGFQAVVICRGPQTTASQPGGGNASGGASAVLFVVGFVVLAVVGVGVGITAFVMYRRNRNESHRSMQRLSTTDDDLGESSDPRPKQGLITRNLVESVEDGLPTYPATYDQISIPDVAPTLVTVVRDSPTPPPRSIIVDHDIDSQL